MCDHVYTKESFKFLPCRFDAVITFISVCIKYLHGMIMFSPRSDVGSTTTFSDNGIPVELWIPSNCTHQR